jgi:hypothetical protein
MGTKKEQHLTAEEFECLAERIMAIGAAYRMVGSTMRSRGIELLGVLGIDTLESVTLGRVNGPLASAHRALLAACTSNRQVSHDPSVGDIESQASDANQIAAGRRNQQA